MTSLGTTEALSEDEDAWARACSGGLLGHIALGHFTWLMRGRVGSNLVYLLIMLP